MKSLYHFIRLTRPLNLAVIALTMAVFQKFLAKYQGGSFKPIFSDYSAVDLIERDQNSFFNHPVFEFNFLLLVLSTVLIAAAGNIINDYFDVKADRVNKPEGVIIDVHIKRRMAILWNWIFNSAGLFIALYLSWQLSNWWIVIVSFISVNLLWFYSAFFKRRFLIGNMLVAFLTAVVPIYVLIFYLPLETIDIAVHDSYYILPASLIVMPTLAIAAVAFWINLIREIIKDIADVKGDLLLKADTIPIRWGIKKAKWALFVLLLPLLISFFMYIIYSWGLDFTLNGGSRGLENYNPPLIGANLQYFGSCAVLVLICVVASYITLLVSNKRKNYLLSSNLLKLAMFFGLLTPLFL